MSKEEVEQNKNEKKKETPNIETNEKIKEEDKEEIKEVPFKLSNKPKKNAVLIERKTKKTKDELLINYDLTNLEYLPIETEEEYKSITTLIKNILLSSNLSFLIYAYSKIFGYLKSLFFTNLFFFIGIKILYKFLNTKSKKDELNIPKASLWKRLILFNLPELLIIFYYHRRKLTKINTAIYSLFTFLNEKISFIYNNNESQKFLIQVDQQNYNIFLMQKGPKDEHKFNKNDIMYINVPEVLEEECFFEKVIAYPNANFEDFDFDNLTKDEENMYQDIFTFINEIEKKIKEEDHFYGYLGTICSNLSYNNSANYNILNALILKCFSFLINELWINSRIKKKRKTLLKSKEKDFNEKNMNNGYFLAINDYVILLFQIKDEYKNFENSYNDINSKCKKLLKCYFDDV